MLFTLVFSTCGAQPSRIWAAIQEFCCSKNGLSVLAELHYNIASCNRATVKVGIFEFGCNTALICLHDRLWKRIDAHSNSIYELCQ